MGIFDESADSGYCFITVHSSTTGKHKTEGSYKLKSWYKCQVIAETYKG